jgi:alpha-tubulin suppressor-like RCC1 family protein
MAIKIASKQVASLATATAGSTETAPIISSIVVSNPSFTTELDDTAIGITGANVKIKGTGFTSNYNLTWNNTNITSSSYFVSSTEIRANVPATGAGSYSFMLFNNASRAGAIYSGIPVSGFPTWSSLSYSAANINSISVQLTATGDTPLIYSLVSGSLPANVTLSSSGLLSGANTTAGTYNFVVNIDDPQLQSNSQTISLTIINAPPTVGALWNWGKNNYGKLGDNSTIDKSSPVQTIASGTNWANVSYGYAHALAVKSDGTLWAWGGNNYGMLGNNDAIDRSSPVQTVAGGTNWSSVAAGSFFSAAIKTDGTLWTWGNNFYGQLGNNTRISGSFGVSSPIQTISGGSNWKQVSIGRSNISTIKTDGTLWSWGVGDSGELGNNQNGANLWFSSPIQTISGGNNWATVSAGNQNCAAIKTDGTLWLWGLNNQGQLGDNTVTSKSSPVQTITGGTNWSKVSAGGYTPLAIKTDGTLWSWGYNDFGSIGDNTAIKKSSPVQTITGGTNWSQVAAGQYFAAAIKTDGTLWMWGRNNAGQLGDNTTIGKLSPVQTVIGGTNWIKLPVLMGFNVNSETFGAIKSV